MAVLWQESKEREWGCLALESECVSLWERRAGSPGDVKLVRVGQGVPARWLLLASPEARVSINGSTLLTGARVLADRDEVRTGPDRFFFSGESLPRVAAHAGEATPCPRCKLEIEAGQPAVVCPSCGVAHHQTDELGCWTYAEHCAAGCSQSTDLEGGFRWTPEDE